MNMSKFKDIRVFFRNLGVKGLIRQSILPYLRDDKINAGVYKIQLKPCDVLVLSSLVRFQVPRL